MRNKKGQFIKGHKNIGKPPLGKHWKLSEQTKKRIKKAHLGKHLSPKTEFKKGHKSTFQAFGERNPMYNKKRELSPNWKGGISSKLQQRCSSLWWKELRKLIYQRDNWTCQMCFKKCHDDIQCHHIIPERKGGNHMPENLITLCKKCHIKVDVLNRKY